MNRINACFERLKEAGETALVTYLSAGDPDLETSAKLFDALAGSGADIIEIGMPFSDPMADGPAIQAAGLRALEAGSSVTETLNIATSVRGNHPDLPIILMGYMNPVFQYGVEGFCRDAAKAGVDGLILVDCPPEEAGMIANFARDNHIHLIYLVTPTTDEERLHRIISRASGVLYYVAIAGVTGTSRAVGQGDAQSNLKNRIKWIKQRTDIPVITGFGIRSPEDVSRVKAMGCDGVVVGSSLVEHIHNSDDPIQACTNMTEALKEAL